MRTKFIFLLLSLILFSSFFGKDKNAKNLFAKDAFHILQEGETLYSISKKYKVPVQTLLDSNNIEDVSKIKVASRIFIPSKYTVRDGDTIYGIARDLNVSALELMSLNELNEFSKIRAGDVLIVPQQKDVTGLAKASSGRKETQATGGKGKKVAGGVVASTDYKPLDDPRNYSKKTASSSLLWPVPAKKTFYLEGKVKGIVIESNKGEDVKTITSGKVISTGMQRGFGKVVFVQSKTSHIYVYGGLDRVSVKKNQVLSLNQSIGKVGSEAFSGNARLYFIVYEKNKPIDPATAPRGF